MAIIVRQEIVLAIMGGIFVAETLSVAAQVLYYKFTGGRRIFRMAPLHHHFELGGGKETQVVGRFWIITIMLVPVSYTHLDVYKRQASYGPATTRAASMRKPFLARFSPVFPAPRLSLIAPKRFAAPFWRPIRPM